MRCCFLPLYYSSYSYSSLPFPSSIITFCASPPRPVSLSPLYLVAAVLLLLPVDHAVTRWVVFVLVGAIGFHLLKMIKSMIDVRSEVSPFVLLNDR